MRVELNATNHRVIVDRARIQQVFWNILKNAQQFTSEGGTISIRCFNEGQEKLLLRSQTVGKESNLTFCRKYLNLSSKERHRRKVSV
jgi:signal transduction histidine kinase